MAFETTVCHDMYLRHTDNSGGSYVLCHRVWDGDRFLTAQQAAAKKIASDAFNQDRLCLAKVELIDEATYRKERTK